VGGDLLTVIQSTRAVFSRWPLVQEIGTVTQVSGIFFSGEIRSHVVVEFEIMTILKRRISQDCGVELLNNQVCAKTQTIRRC
jgi:hypothetical protein